MLDFIDKYRVSIGLFVLAGILLVTRQISAYYVGTVLPRFIQSIFPFLATMLLPVVALIVLGSTVFLLSETQKISPWTAAICTILALGLVGSIVGGFFVTWRSHYNGLRNYTEYVVEEESPHPEYLERLNYPQARLLLQRSLQGVVGNLSDPNYVPVISDDGEVSGRWCSLITRDTWLNRDWTREIACLDVDSGVVTRAEFTGKVGSVEGLWSSKLGDQVASVSRGLAFENADVYGYITPDGEARVVVPVVRKNGYSTAPWDTPAGVVVFHADGSREHVEDLTAGEIPGPVLPASIARNTRSGLNARSDFGDYRTPRRNTDALQDTSSAGDVAVADPNAENVSEFVLVREDGRLVYVTPMTPFGASTNVTAYLEVMADEVTSGDPAQATVYRLETAEAATQRIAQRVASLYDADINWASANEADVSEVGNASRIFEITPTNPGQVVATIGTGDQTLYRVTVESTLNEANNFGSVCVYVYRTSELIRCDDSISEPAPLGALRGLSGGNGTSGTVSDFEGNLSEVPTNELIQELSRRSQDGEL